MIEEKIVIEGVIKGMKFSKTLNVKYDPETETVEEALIHFYNSRALTFEELAVEQRWQNCYWTYPASMDLVG
ncbi:hypothetical protein [Halobacillus sp. Marseille-Q1614]|uniref:hypothetical protein n=1 Tax=Halobacillus sp. Marseille-Q1614 TaxID=2709134 RepID=UPI001570E53F|nr:hypothetical protein [Halobacillus sp. Marseille-Q1614]